MRRSLPTLLAMLLLWALPALAQQATPEPPPAEGSEAAGEAPEAAADEDLTAGLAPAAQDLEPKSLDELMPGLLKEPPNDPFTGKGYIYRLKTDRSGYVVYSIGPNGKDDGGSSNQDRDEKVFERTSAGPDRAAPATASPAE